MTIPSTEVTLHRNELKGVLLPQLLGHVFHVTTAPAWARIQADGAIRANAAGAYVSPFGNYNGFFRNRGCVSVFDLRSAGTDPIELGLSKIYFLNPPKGANEPVFLFLSEACVAKLRSWSDWKQEEAFGEQVVPYIEAGHFGEIALDQITRALVVRVNNPPTEFEQLLAEGRAKAARRTAGE